MCVCVFLLVIIAQHTDPFPLTGHKREGLTLAHDARQSGLELFFGLLHLLLMLTLLGGQPADVAVGRLDHGVEVVGVAAVDLASFQPGQQDAHRLRKLAIICPKPEDREEESRVKINETLPSPEGGHKQQGGRQNDAQGMSCMKKQGWISLNGSHHSREQIFISECRCKYRQA